MRKSKMQNLITQPNKMLKTTKMEPVAGQMDYQKEEIYLNKRKVTCHIVNWLCKERRLCWVDSFWTSNVPELNMSWTKNRVWFFAFSFYWCKHFSLNQNTITRFLHWKSNWSIEVLLHNHVFGIFSLTKSNILEQNNSLCFLYKWCVIIALVGRLLLIGSFVEGTKRLMLSRSWVNSDHL